MTYDNTDNNDDGTVEAPVNNQSVHTESLQDANDGQAWETLHEAGYEKGDDVWKLAGFSDAAQSTASDSYTTFREDATRLAVVWDDILPSDTQGRIIAWGRVDPGSDAIDIRIQNESDGETVVENTGITSNRNFKLGPVDYTPTTTNGPTFSAFQFRNQDNATSVTVSRVQIGVGWSI